MMSLKAGFLFPSIIIEPPLKDVHPVLMPFGDHNYVIVICMYTNQFALKFSFGVCYVALKHTHQ